MSNLSTTIKIASIIDQQIILTNLSLAIFDEMQNDLTANQALKIHEILKRFRDDLRSEKVLLEATLQGE